MGNERTFAVGRHWWVESEKPAGGYVLVREQAILDAWQALADGRIQLRDLRAWLGCFELRSRRMGLKTDRRPTFTPAELGALIECPQDRLVRASARRLEAAGLAGLRAHRLILADGQRQPGMGRLVPIPRRLLRALCKPHGKAFLATALAHILRSLFYRKGRVVSGGYCKASDVAAAFGVSERAVRDARQAMIDAGWMTAFTADQRRLNRLGLPIRFDLQEADPTDPQHPRTTPAPQPHAGGTPSAGPDQHKNPSLRKIKHQNPAPRVDRKKGDRERKPRAPTLKNVSQADLRDNVRLAALHHQAVTAGLARGHGPGVVAFYALAEHALAVGRSNPPGLFAWLLHGRKQHYATLADEDSARRRLDGERRSNPRSAPAGLSRAGDLLDAVMTLAAGPPAGRTGVPIAGPQRPLCSWKE